MSLYIYILKVDEFYIHLKRKFIVLKALHFFQDMLDEHIFISKETMRSWSLIQANGVGRSSKFYKRERTWSKGIGVVETKGLQCLSQENSKNLKGKSKIGLLSSTLANKVGSAYIRGLSDCWSSLMLYFHN